MFTNVTAYDKPLNYCGLYKVGNTTALVTESGIYRAADTVKVICDSFFQYDRFVKHDSDRIKVSYKPRSFGV